MEKVKEQEEEEVLEQVDGDERYCFLEKKGRSL